jgi:hypothetical protein
MFQLIERFNRKPSADELAQRELDDMRRELLEMQRKRDYYQKMSEFCLLRIDKIRTQLKDSAHEQAH